MSKFCVICGNLLVGRQRVLCSNKECRREWTKNYNHEYRQNNAKRIGEQRREYRQNNIKKIKEYSHDYYQSNQEILKEYGREYSRNYYQDNREERLEYDRRCWRNKPEKKKESGRKWYLNNRERLLEKERKRYRTSRGLPEDADLRKESSLERIMREWLQENDIEFIEQYYVNLENSTWTHVDFFIEPNICLYVDGNYYHLLPNAKKCDENQNRILPQMGYNVIRLSEAEILNGIRPNLILAD